jgi:hypothetical protein
MSPDLDLDLRRWLAEAEVWSFRFAARVVFLGILVLFVLASVAVNSVFLAVVFGVFASLLLREILPVQRFRDWAGGYWTGEAGDRWRRRFERVGARLRSLVPLLAVAVVAGASIVGVLAVGPAPAQAATQDGQQACETTVVHKAFRTDEATMNRVANGSTARNTRKNTRVSVGETNQFYNVRGENPNGYCVRIVVEIGSEAIPPAEMPGKVYANHQEIAATWDAVHDFSTGQTHTEVAFTLPPGTDATFAPSEVRVVSVAWYSKTAERSKSAWSSLTDRITDSPNVTKHRYTIAPGGEGVRTVQLVNPKTDERITEYRALWRPSKEAAWRPVKTDTEAGVFKQETDGGDAVQFHFQNATAEVRFYANPGIRDEIDYEVKSYVGAWGVVSEFELPFTTTSGLTNIHNIQS